jgi:hypothetical protein
MWRFRSMNETALVVSAASRTNSILNRYRKPVASIENEAGTKVAISVDVAIMVPCRS